VKSPPIRPRVIAPAPTPSADVVMSTQSVGGAAGMRGGKESILQHLLTSTSYMRVLNHQRFGDTSYL